MQRKYILIAIVIISLVACNLANKVTPVPTATTLPTAPLAPQNPTSSPSAGVAGTQAPAIKGTATSTQEEPTKTPYPTSVLDTSMKDEINLIQSQVVQERGLQPKSQVPVVLLTTSELRNNVVNDFLADYTDEDATDDVYFYSIVGLLEPNFDLKTLYINLFSESIAGEYDPDVKEMFVVSDTGFNGPEHLTYAHEFTHVVQDQNFDLRNGLKYNDDACEANDDSCSAVLALIEGDATVSEFNWYKSYATTEDQQQVIQFYNNLKSPVYDSAPAFIKDDFVFPYTQGQTFVQHFHDIGGWTAVDAVFKDPPLSTEQILHPELYPADQPVAVDLPDLTSALGTGWRLVTRDHMGEWYTYLILARGADQAARLPETDAQLAAAGWGGDEYLVLHNDTANLTSFVMKTVWDTANDAGQFSTMLQKSLNSRIGKQATQQGDSYTWTYSGGYSSLLVSGITTIWVITPDEATAQTISGLVKP